MALFELKGNGINAPIRPVKDSGGYLGESSSAPSTVTSKSCVASQEPSSKRALEATDKDISFYFETYKPTDLARRVFNHVGVLDKCKLLKAHVKNIQLHAWSLFKYPCIGMFEFVRFNLPTYPGYSEMLAVLKAGGKYLDVGCCMGQDVRYLITEGIPGENLYGIDLHEGFIDLGYDLFMDRSTLKARLEPADLFDDQSWIFQELTGQFEVIHASYLLHLFAYEKQFSAALRMVRLLKKKKGVMIVGRSVGSSEPKTYIHPTVGVMYRHDATTFERFWNDVGKAAGVAFAVATSVASTTRVSADGKVFDHPPEEKAIDISFSITML